MRDEGLRYLGQVRSRETGVNFLLRASLRDRRGISLLMKLCTILDMLTEVYGGWGRWRPCRRAKQSATSNYIAAFIPALHPSVNVPTRASLSRAYSPTNASLLA